MQPSGCPSSGTHWPVGRSADRLVADLATGAGERPLLRDVVRRAFLIALDRAWQEHMNALDFMRRQGNAIYGGSPDEVLHAYEQAAHRRFARVMSAVEPAARQIITDTLRQPP